MRSRARAIATLGVVTVLIAVATAGVAPGLWRRWRIRREIGRGYVYDAVDAYARLADAEGETPALLAEVAAEYIGGALRTDIWNLERAPEAALTDAASVGLGTSARVRDALAVDFQGAVARGDDRAIRALARSGDPSALAALVKAVRPGPGNDDMGEEASTAALILAERGDDAALRWARGRADDPLVSDDPEAPSRIIGRLGGGQADLDRLAAILRNSRYVEGLVGAIAGAKQLAARDADVRDAAVRFLREASTDPPSNAADAVQREAIIALALLGELDEADALARLGATRDGAGAASMLRLRLAVERSRSGGLEGVAALRGLIESGGPHALAAVVEASLRPDHPARPVAADWLRARLSDGDGTADERAWLAHLLGRVGDQSDLPLLRTLLIGEPEEEICAAGAILRIVDRGPADVSAPSRSSAPPSAPR